MGLVELGKGFLGEPMEMSTKSVRIFVSHVPTKGSAFTSEASVLRETDFL